MRITFVITGLGLGGAEVMLVKLLSSIDRQRFSPSVISLAPPGVLAPHIERLEVPIYFLNIPPGKWSVSALLRLIRLLRQLRPDLIQGWMYHGNLAAQLAAITSLRRVPVIWNIRGTIIELRRESVLTALTISLGARLARRAHAIVNNSELSSRRHIEELGYPARNTVIIPNGFDVDVFKPNPVARREARNQLGLDPDSLVIGHVGRLHPMKDHEGLLDAVALVNARLPKVYVLLVGNDVNSRSELLRRRAQALGIAERVCYLGPRHNIESLLPAFDLLALSSAYGEGFPNAVGEAMACAVPCVVTDVGDCARLVGDTGLVVSPRNPRSFAEACYGILSRTPIQRAKLGDAARRRIVENYSLKAITREYEALYERLSATVTD